MGFLSYSLNYFANEIKQIETSVSSPQTVYHAKQLLKILSDLLDEGYKELNDLLETFCKGVSRLKDYLKCHNAEPFPAFGKILTETDIDYGLEQTELSKAVSHLIVSANASIETSNNVFLSELISFCEWVGYKANTAYIFLLRDTLLPYVYFQNEKRSDIHPWLLSRKTLEILTGKTSVDDEFRASVYKALELGKGDNFENFCKVVLPDMRLVLKKYPELEKCLMSLLRTVKNKHIIVIESGCSGTFPMLLKSLDERIDMRMYTTYPYLLKTYGDRIYTSEYEKNRLFETLYSQDLYFQFAALKENRFYVRTCNNKQVEKNSCAEVKSFLKLSALNSDILK